MLEVHKYETYSKFGLENQWRHPVSVDITVWG